MRIKPLVISILKEHGCLNTMEICRALNEKNPFNYRYCGTPVYSKPFNNKGRILEIYRHQTGNGVCWHYKECKFKYKALFRALKKSNIPSIKRTAPDYNARIKKSKLKTDLFRYWFLEPREYEKRLIVDRKLTDF